MKEIYGSLVAECRKYLAAWFPERKENLENLALSSSHARLLAVKKTACTIMTKGSKEMMSNYCSSKGGAEPCLSYNPWPDHCVVDDQVRLQSCATVILGKSVGLTLQGLGRLRVVAQNPVSNSPKDLIGSEPSETSGRGPNPLNPKLCARA